MLDQSISKRTIARWAGVLYLVIFFAGLFAEFIVRQSMLVAGDATATAENILASESLFRLGMVGDLTMIMADVAIAILFYILLKPVNQLLALMAAFFRLAQATALGLNLVNVFFVAELVGGAEYLSALTGEQSDALVLFFLNGHAAGYRFALIFFAFSILILGYLMVKSQRFPSILGIGLMIAAVGYTVDGVASFLLLNYADMEDVFGMIVFGPAVIAELAVALWLLLKGERRDPASVSTPQAEMVGA